MPSAHSFSASRADLPVNRQFPRAHHNQRSFDDVEMDPQEPKMDEKGHPSSDSHVTTSITITRPSSIAPRTRYLYDTSCVVLFETLRTRGQLDAERAR